MVAVNGVEAVLVADPARVVAVRWAVKGRLREGMMVEVAADAVPFMRRQ